MGMPPVALCNLWVTECIGFHYILREQVYLPEPVTAF